MTIATLNLRVAPRRMLSEREAAAYCGIPAKRIAAAVPPIVMPGGAKLYDMHDCDAWLDGLKGGDVAADDDILGKLD
ncbi:hypothetical protein [Mesorhizobium sp. M0220]|uniref:hypothetical protein n=1 Tax=unclassified Mesorhizobium TaxID=325217 RepID=UPI00333DB279